MKFVGKVSVSSVLMPQLENVDGCPLRWNNKFAPTPKLTIIKQGNINIHQLIQLQQSFLNP